MTQLVNSNTMCFITVLPGGLDRSHSTGSCPDIRNLNTGKCVLEQFLTKFDVKKELVFTRLCPLGTEQRWPNVSILKPAPRPSQHVPPTAGVAAHLDAPIEKWHSSLREWMLFLNCGCAEGGVGFGVKKQVLVYLASPN